MMEQVVAMEMGSSYQGAARVACMRSSEDRPGG
jgi:hypothetical protein